MTCNSLKFLIVFGVFLLSSCSDEKTIEKAEIQKADSISIRLNSPELKAINSRILEDPANAKLYNDRAKIYTNLKEYGQAINDAKRAIRIDSTEATYFLTLADAYFIKNETRLAKESLELIEKKFPANVEALLKLAEIYYLVENYQKGIDYVNKALRIDEHLAKAYYIKGTIYRESGDTSKAVSSLETAVEQDNSFEDAYYDIGIIYAARKNPIAFEYYDNVLRVNPANSNALYAKAKLYQDLGRNNEAVVSYENILKTDAGCINCNYNLGAIYLEIKKQPQKALEYFTKAIETDPSYVDAYLARGYTYAILKDKESAKADYNMCLRLKPNYPPAIDGLNNL